MVHLLLNNKTTLTILCSIVLTIALCSCSNSNGSDNFRFNIPKNEYKIPVVDSLKLLGYNIQGTNFEVKYHHWQMLTIDSYLQIKHYFSKDSIIFTNCDQVIYYPSFTFLKEEHYKHNEKLGNLLAFRVQNLIAIRETNGEFIEKAFYISWLNKPILVEYTTPHHYTSYDSFYSDGIDSTTFEVFTTLDTNLLRNLYPEYRGNVTRINIDTIYLPLIERNTLDYYPEIRIDSFYYGNCTLPHHFFRTLKIRSKEELDSLKKNMDTIPKFEHVYL